MDKFDKGREYERLESSKSLHLFMGWGLLIFGLILLVVGIWSPEERFSSIFLLILFGLASLYIGYSEKKQLKTLFSGRKNG